jgi:hypothetical protein
MPALVRSSLFTTLKRSSTERVAAEVNEEFTSLSFQACSGVRPDVLGDGRDEGGLGTSQGSLGG